MGYERELDKMIKKNFPPTIIKDHRGIPRYATYCDNCRQYVLNEEVKDIHKIAGDRRK